MTDGAGDGRCSNALGAGVGALAVLQRSMFAPDGAGLSELGRIARMEAPTKILAGPLATQDLRRDFIHDSVHESESCPEF